LAQWFLRRRFLCEFPIGSYVKFGCGGHLYRRAEPPDTFLEENHPMTISSIFWDNMKQPAAILVLQYWYTILVISVFYQYLRENEIKKNLLL
jgi:hypothetical protein